MSGVNVTLDDELAQAMLARLAQIVARPQAALSQSAQSLRRLIIDTFSNQTDPWAGAGHVGLRLRAPLALAPGVRARFCVSFWLVGF